MDVPARQLATALLGLACGARHGIVPPWQRVPTLLADLPATANVFVGGARDRDEFAVAGGFGRSLADASSAAIAEALERYCAHMARYEVRRGAQLSEPSLDAAEFSLFSEEQRCAPGFPFPRVPRGEARYARVYSLADNRPLWVPEELVGLGSRSEAPALPSTSSGLAAARDASAALLRGLEELLERDALTVTWLAGLGGRELALPEVELEQVRARGGEVVALELTQAWNPHPVVVVMGQLPARGLRRYSMGAACRRSRAEALDKAFLEWLQGVSFAGHWLRENPGARLDRPEDVRTFDQHGAYYTLHPERWPDLPLWTQRRAASPSPPSAPTEAPPAQALCELQRALAAAGVRLLYRDLTLPDVRDVGLSVVRVLSPDLALLHGDERLPFLGGRTRDVAWRYPDVAPPDVAFPNRHPHPLG